VKNTLFRFKQFQVDQSRSAMKIGTDGVLLGAWTPLKKQPETLLDIGSGTGLVALMLAQRTLETQITGVEIEAAAAAEASLNFHNSPWSDRLKLVHTDIQQFVANSSDSFDLIVCNPPFFTTPYKFSDTARSTARDNNHLRYDDLFFCVDQLLSVDGSFTLVCPFEYRDDLIALGLQQQLYLVQELRVKGNHNSSFKRILMHFERIKNTLITEELILEEERNQRTAQHQMLVQDFYL
jgi:tRNA1Val (adenine37-N6)-methyltransferase